MKKLNGWERLWAVICLFIGILLLVTAIKANFTFVDSIEMFGVWIFAAALLYALGLTVGWVIRGFKNDEKR